MPTVQDVIRAVLHRVGHRPLYRTGLVKLVYLVDYTFFRMYGRTLTGLTYMWDQYGPNAIGNAVLSEADLLVNKGLVILTEEPNIYGSLSYLYRLDVGGERELPALTAEATAVIDDVVGKYGRLPLQRLVAASKATEPFKAARQYQVLEMKQDLPTEGTTEADARAFFAQLDKDGAIPADEVASRYGLEWSPSLSP